MNDDKGLLQGDESDRFCALLDDLYDAMKGTDRQRIQDLSHQIDEVTAPFAQRRIERDLELALSGKHTDHVSDQLGIPK